MLMARTADKPSVWTFNAKHSDGKTRSHSIEARNMTEALRIFAQQHRYATIVGDPKSVKAPAKKKKGASPETQDLPIEGSGG
jgi:hypothetical protein